MKCLVCCVVFVCFLLGFFLGCLYLIMVVDPGLLGLQEKAVAMIRADRGEPELPTIVSTILPPEDYMDAASLLKNLIS